jgi:salicylate hydroxylase
MLEGYEGDVDKAFLAHQEIRIPRTARVQRTARLFGDIIHCDSVGALMRNVLLSQRAADDYTYTDWFYGYSTERKEISDGH